MQCGLGLCCSLISTQTWPPCATIPSMDPKLCFLERGSIIVAQFIACRRICLTVLHMTALVYFAAVFMRRAHKASLRYGPSIQPFYFLQQTIILSVSSFHCRTRRECLEIRLAPSLFLKYSRFASRPVPWLAAISH